MNKNVKFYVIGWAILLAIFNVAAFVSPAETETMTKFGGAFWAGYAFITLAFLGQLGVSLIAFKESNLQKFFYKIPLVRISWTGLILTLIFGSLCMIIPNVPNWVGIILCFAVLGFNGISVVKANAAADLVSETDDKIKMQTAFVKFLIADADTLLASAKSDAVKAECKKVYDAVRYSDPMSNPMLAAVEGQITVKFTALTDAVKADDAAVVSAVAEELLILIKDRNNKCKILK